MTVEHETEKDTTEKTERAKKEKKLGRKRPRKPK